MAKLISLVIPLHDPRIAHFLLKGFQGFYYEIPKEKARLPAFSKFFSSDEFNYREKLDAVLENSGNSLDSIKSRLEKKSLFQFETWLSNDKERI